MKSRQSAASKQSFIPRSERPDFRLERPSPLDELRVRDLDVILGIKFANEERLNELNDESATGAVLNKGIEKHNRDDCDFLSSWSSGGRDLQRYFETMFPIAKQKKGSSLWHAPRDKFR